MAIFIDTKNKKLNFIIDSLGVVFYLFIMAMLLYGMFKFFFPDKTEPTDLSFMLLPYLGIPFVFWLFVSLGLFTGLTFNGFKVVVCENKTYNKGENK